MKWPVEDEYIPLEVRHFLEIHRREARRLDAMFDMIAIPLFLAAFAIWELIF